MPRMTPLKAGPATGFIGAHFRTLLLSLVVVALVPGVAGAAEAVPAAGETIIADCRQRSALERQSGDGVRTRQGMIETVTCLREEFLWQYRALIERYVDFDALIGASPETARQRYLLDYERQAQEGSCYPSCTSIGESKNLDADARNLELLISDMIAERNLYRSSPEGVPGLVFAHVRDSEQLIRDCWRISDGMRMGTQRMVLWGLYRTVQCLEHVILDQTEVFHRIGAPVSRLDATEILVALEGDATIFFDGIYLLNRACSKLGDCGVEVREAPLRERAYLLGQVVRIVVEARTRRGL